MTIIDYLKQQFIEEGAITRKFLALVHDGDWHYKPHEKSMPMNALATHIADLPGWFHMTLTTDELDFAKLILQKFPDPISMKLKVLLRFQINPQTQ